LDENTEKGPVYALHRLNAMVDVFWPEISDSISKVYVSKFKSSFLFVLKSFSESLYEDENFKHRELAALVSSKVYYHLGSLDNALTYALGAGRLFDVNDKTEYVETIIGWFIFINYFSK
jgi:26S proteasome regulatory subunit N2